MSTTVYKAKVQKPASSGAGHETSPESTKSAPSKSAAEVERAGVVSDKDRDLGVPDGNAVEETDVETIVVSDLPIILKSGELNVYQLQAAKPQHAIVIYCVHLYIIYGALQEASAPIFPH